MAWNHDSIRHSLAARGIRIKRKPVSSTYDVRGLESLVDKRHELKSSTGQVKVKFYDWDVVIDTSRLGERPRKEQLASAPVYILGMSPDKTYGEVAWVFVGKGGTFEHPKHYADNDYMQPIGYQGMAEVFIQPLELSALLPNGEPVPFVIAGFVGLEEKVKRQTLKYELAKSA